MTTFTTCDVDQLVQAASAEPHASPCKPEDCVSAGNLSDQYLMSRQQHISFTKEEADRINQTLDLIERCTGKNVSPNKLIKQATMQRAERVLSQGES